MSKRYRNRYLCPPGAPQGSEETDRIEAAVLQKRAALPDMEAQRRDAEPSWGGSGEPSWGGSGVREGFLELRL